MAKNQTRQVNTGRVAMDIAAPKAAPKTVK
jgi:hypothetical protein